MSWYRRELDRVLAARKQAGADLVRSSSGQSQVDFEPDVSKTFNRGFTTYFIQGRAEPPGAIDSPKMVGERLGTVTSVQGQSLMLDSIVMLNSGDGLCWFDEQHDLCGTAVNLAQPTPGGALVSLQDMSAIRPGLVLYRNRDHLFLRQVERSQPVREMGVRFRLETPADGFTLYATDEDGNTVAVALATEREIAQKPERAAEAARKQLAKTGGTPFACTGVDLAWDQPYFLPVATLNGLRREALERLLAERAANRPRMRGGIEPNNAPYPETTLSYRGNALNRQAVAFYRRHGVTDIEPAAESGLDMSGRVVMRSRYCIKHQLGLCDGTRQASGLREPLSLVDGEGHHYRLRFDCAACEMEVISP